MLILKITEHELTSMGETRPSLTSMTPHEKAIRMLHRGLKTVNQAGLDGKEIVETTITCTYDHELRDQVYEIHGKVKHRLRQPATT